MGGANPLPPPPPTDTHTFESVGRGTCPRCPPSRTPLNYSVNVNEQYLIPLINQVIMYRINNELELNRRNNSTYLEGPLGPERG